MKRAAAPEARRRSDGEPRTSLASGLLDSTETDAAGIAVRGVVGRGWRGIPRFDRFHLGRAGEKARSRTIAFPRPGCKRAAVVVDPSGHTPVLPGAVLTCLSPGRGDTVVDATVGGGGHARLLAEAIGPVGTLIGLDVDGSSLSAAEEALRDSPCRVVLIRENFGSLGRAMDAAGIGSADVILADLGVRSAQLNDASRGFSFQTDGPLDMRLDDRLTTTAADLVNGLREQALADVIYFNADERHSRRIAKRICEVRRERRIATTGMLSDVVCGALGADPASRKQKIHPATRVFQALRIAVNDELGALDRLLAAAPERLSVGGRLGVISFHSLEDGRVKRDFRSRQADGIYAVLTKRPMVADEDERNSNSRSRSAKFRVAKRIA